MAGNLLSVFLAVLSIAVAAAGFVTPEFALWWWALAGALLIASLGAWLVERRRTPPQPPPSASTTGSQSPAISGDHNTVTYDSPAPKTNASLDRAIDQLLAEGNALRDRLMSKVTWTMVDSLLRDTRAWQERCVDSVGIERVAVFKAHAGTHQPLMGQSGWAISRNWRRPYEERLERWMRALTDLHS